MKKTMLKIRNICSRNSPKILSALATLAGIGAGAMLVRGTVKAVRTVDEMKENGEELKPKEVIKRVVPHYIPAMGLIGITTVCGFKSYSIQAKRCRVLKSEMLAQHEGFKSLKKAAIESIGKEAFKKIEHTSMDAQEPIQDGVRIDEEVYVYEPISRQRIKTTYRILKEAENEINYMINSPEWTYGRASLGCFIQILSGIKPSFWDDFYWDSEYMYLNYATTVVSFYEEIYSDSNGRKLIIIDYSIGPERENIIDESIEGNYK